MKTLREYIDQLDEISRRGFLKGAGAAAVGAAGGTPWNKGKKGLQVAWNKGIIGSASHLSNKRSEKHKKNIGANSKARMNTPEMKEKYRQIKLEYWAKKKAGIAPALS
jgi:anaerobic selenocysteine-containing dehydrogenase